MKKHILFVDEEPYFLKAIKRSFRSMKDNWIISTAPSVEKAVEVLVKSHVDILVTEIRLQGIDGIKFLNLIKEKYPHIARIVLSGYANRDVVLKSVEIAHQYISKPCDDEDLKATVNKAFLMRDLLENDSLKAAIANIDSLPSLPGLYVEIMDELNSEDPSIGKIGAIVGKDIAMSAKMLQLINSSFFGIPQKITSPEKAVNMLGVELVQAIVLTAGAFSKYEKVNLQGFSISKLWDHCINAAAIAKLICRVEKFDKEFTENCFMAGLLHDIGIILGVINFPEESIKIAKVMKDKKCLQHEAEYEVMGTTHAEVGAYLLGLWGLPEPIIEAVALHHNPFAGNMNNLTPLSIVHLANALERAGERIKDEDTPLTGVDYDYLAKLKLTDRFKAWRKACALKSKTA